MSAKYWFLIAVVAGLVAWAGVETQRLFVAKRQLAASVELQQATSQRAQLLHLKSGQSLAGKK